MSRHQRAMTLGELIRVVADCSRNDHEVGLAVADLNAARCGCASPPIRSQSNAPPCWAQSQKLINGSRLVAFPFRSLKGGNKTAAGLTPCRCLV